MKILQFVKAASAICLKKMPSIVDKSSVKMICVDDFALRKRFSYGTVMINFEYSCAVTPQVRQTGNRLSGLAGTAYASLLT